MQSYKTIIRPVLFSLAFVSAPLMANDCGEVPQAPEVVDGASTSMDDLVANSQSVKAFIADADAYLDCNETFIQSDGFKDLEPAEQQAALDTNTELLKARNQIGEDFNEEVAAYKAANPQ